MKTKTNKVPLVGPRGRKELLEKINELEEKVAELAATQPETHVLAVKNMCEGQSADYALNLLEYDGAKPTMQQLSEMDLCNTFVTLAFTDYPIKLQILGVRALSYAVEIFAGYYLSADSVEGGELVHILVSTESPVSSVIEHVEL